MYSMVKHRAYDLSKLDAALVIPVLHALHLGERELCVSKRPPIVMSILFLAAGGRAQRSGESSALGTSGRRSAVTRKPRVPATVAGLERRRGDDRSYLSYHRPASPLPLLPLYRSRHGGQRSRLASATVSLRAVRIV